jgi:hypothetical protein
MPSNPRTTVDIDGSELTIRIVVETQKPDELVPITQADLEPFGLELRPIRRLIAAGKLRVVEIGRRRFTKRSFLLALVDELPAVRGPQDADKVVVDPREAARRAYERLSREPLTKRVTCHQS